MSALTPLAARDLFLLAKAIASPDSMKLAGLIFDAVVATLGEPGVGYDPACLNRTAFDCAREPRRLMRECEERGGIDALRAEGWL